MTREIFSLYADMVRLGFEMSQLTNADNTLTWLGIAMSGGQQPFWEIPYSVAAMCVLAYVASVYFFVRIRRQAGEVFNT